MKVKTIKVQNLKALSSMTVDFDWCTAIITGGNNKGKSSFLKSLPERLQWEKPKEVLKKWEEEGFAMWELTDGSQFIWEFKEDKEKLSYITSEGVSIKTWVIKELGKKYFWSRFDIDEFLQSEPKKQKNILQKIVGIDLSELDMLYKKAYDIRSEKNIVYKNEKSKVEGMELVKVDGDIVNIDEMQNVLLEAEKHNQNFWYIEKWIIQKQEEIEELNKKINSLQEDIKKGNDWLAKNTKRDVDILRTQIEDAKKKNELLKSNEYIKQHLENVEVTRIEREKTDAEVKSIEQKKMDIIKSAKLPEWFEFVEEGIMYNGFPLDKNQLSSSSIYIASLKLASMVLGEIKTMCFDASYLDNNSLQEVEKRANDNWLQLLIERPDYEGWEIKYEFLSDT